jgi:phage-related protein (TIGR01555 family)
MIPSRRKERMRQDGYLNAMFGQGYRFTDPFAHYRQGVDFVSDTQCTHLYTYNGIAKAIIDIPADESMRNGFEVEIDGMDDDAINRQVQSLCEDLDVQYKFSEALAWADLYGGSIIVVMADDGRMIDEPLNYDSLRRIEKLKVFDKTNIVGAKQYQDASAPQYMDVEQYYINTFGANPMWVHESRVLRFDGGRLPLYQRNHRLGWGAKRFESVKEEIERYCNGHEYALQALTRLSQDVIKLDGLTNILTMEGGDVAVQKRMQMVDMVRSMMNSIAIDGADEYDRKGLSLSGIKELLEQFEIAICSCTGIPATKLFGRSPAGMNSTGKADLENFYNMIEGIQKNKVKPNLVRLIEMLNACRDYKLNLPETWHIEFEPLWSMSKAEKADIEKTKAEAQRTKADAINTLINAQVLDATEARATLAEEKDYIMDRSLDSALMRSGNE